MKPLKLEVLVPDPSQVRMLRCDTSPVMGSVTDVCVITLLQVIASFSLVMSDMRHDVRLLEAAYHKILFSRASYITTGQLYGRNHQ